MFHSFHPNSSGKSSLLTDVLPNQYTTRGRKYIPASCVPYVGEELFLLVCVSLVEFVNATCSIDEFHLTCVEWVRSV